MEEAYLKIAICDDNHSDALYLVSLMEGAHTYRIFSSAEELAYEIEDQQEHFDLYILDIFLGEMNGIQLGKYIRQLDDEALICYVSSSPEYYGEAFSLYAFQYLLKPVVKEDFQELLRKASTQFARNKEQSIKLDTKRRTIVIPYRRILYITSMGHTLYIHCKDGTVERMNGRLNELAAVLDSNVFVRSHQSFLVNLYNVSALESDYFICGGDQIPISRRYSSAKERYREFLFSDMD